MNSTDIRTDIATRLRHWRIRLATQRLWAVLAIVSAAFALARLSGLATPYWLALMLVVALLGFISLLMSRKWQALDPQNFALHLNRRFPAFEESAQLLLQDPGQLGVLQQLQRQRASLVYAQSLAKVDDWQPSIRYRNWLIIILAALLIAVFAQQLKTMTRQWVPPAFVEGISSQSASSPIAVSEVTVIITPPAYSSLEASSVDQLDLDVLEGSEIQWSLLFTGKPSDAYAIETSDGQRWTMEKSDKGRWQTVMTANNTDLYRLLAIDGDETTLVGDIYALTVQLDQNPDIRIIEPANTTLELPKNGPVTFESEVLIRDDFGIDKVEILASVAKGSGEGVKFRDQKLEFELSTPGEKGTVYQRHWDLRTLGMEPGDEIYFSIVATDNKQPEANISRSTTVIVRWLEDDKPGVSADSLAIDFIPEFFKSQRQIIIDTEQLIEDQPNLASQVFKDTSYGIGQAQADLKQKYGQFLGDEFGEGPGEQLGPANSQSASGHTDEDHSGDNQDEDQHDADHQEGQAVADAHGHTDSGVTINNATNINDIVKLFGHDHGDPELGKINKQSPVALMKRAVSEMWSAERHLMQAEPELALPFEYEAYKFLKLARQADRIYVKRLGFEPPPVTEDRRLAGKLTEIRSYSTAEQADPQALSQARQTQQLLRQSWKMISSHVPNASINPEQDKILGRMSDQFKQMSQQRPALIKQAATLEKLRAAKAWRLGNCENCLTELQQSIWNLMDDGDAPLQFPASVYDPEDEMIKTYQLELQSGPRPANGAGQPLPAAADPAS